MLNETSLFIFMGQRVVMALNIQLPETKSNS